AVGLVVTGDAGDGGVPQPHLRDRLGHAARLVTVERPRPAGGDVAEVAPSGADVAPDEEGRLAVLPALVDVGAAGLLADRVQAGPLHPALHLRVLGPHRGLGPDPLGFALDRGLRVARLDVQRTPSVDRGHRPARVSHGPTLCRGRAGTRLDGGGVREPGALGYRGGPVGRRGVRCPVRACRCGVSSSTASPGRARRRSPAGSPTSPGCPGTASTTRSAGSLAGCRARRWSSGRSPRGSPRVTPGCSTPPTPPGATS